MIQYVGVVENQSILMYVRNRRNPEEGGSVQNVAQTFTIGRLCAESLTHIERRLTLVIDDIMDEEILGIGLADKVSILEHKPILRTPGQTYRESEEYQKFVFTPEKESKAVDELTHWRRFKERVDRAYKYAAGERLMEIDDEKKIRKSPITIITYIIVGLSMIAGATLLIINRMN
jgi:hypothetical protein